MISLIINVYGVDANTFILFRRLLIVQISIFPCTCMWVDVGPAVRTLSDVRSSVLRENMGDFNKVLYDLLSSFRA